MRHGYAASLAPLYALLLAIGSLATPTCVPPAGAEEAGTFTSPLQPGRWSLRFALDLGGYGSGTLSAKRHFSDHSAVQLDLTATIGSNRGSNNFLSQNETTELNDTENSSDREQFTVRTAYVLYPRPGGRTAVYFSAGPFVSFDHSHDDQVIEATAPDRVEYDTGRNSTWSVGALTRIGFEWFFLSKLSLGTEYGVAAAYSHSSSVDTNQGVIVSSGEPFLHRYDRTNRAFSLYTTQLGFGMTYYF